MFEDNVPEIIGEIKAELKRVCSMLDIAGIGDDWDSAHGLALRVIKLCNELASAEMSVHVNKVRSRDNFQSTPKFPGHFDPQEDVR